MKNIKWKFALGILVSLVFLYLAFRKVKTGDLAQAFRIANYWHVAPAVALSLLSIWFRAVRWKYLMNPIKKIGIYSLFSSTAIGFMSNSFLPARLGEFVRAYVIGKKEGISKSSAFATVVVSRIFDGMTILFFFGIILLRYSYIYPGWLQKTIYFAFIFYFAALAFIILLKIRTDQVTKFISFLLRPFPAKVNRMINRLIGSFITGLESIKSAKAVITASVISLLVWLPNAFVIYIVAHSFGLDIPVSGAFLLMVIFCFGMMIPSAPGFVGNIQYFSVLGLSLFGVARASALSFSIVYHLTTFLPITALGLIFLFIEGYSLMELRETADEEKKSMDADA